MNTEDIRRIDSLARAHFIYKADPANLDTWRSRADDIDKTWFGDCDDLAITVLDLLGRAGLPFEQRFRLLISSARNGDVDHMVACAVDDAGRFLIVGDVFSEAYFPPCISGQILRYQRMDEWRREGRPVWREGAPFS